MQIFALPLVALAGLAAGALAEGTCSGPNARTEPPAGAIVVDATGAYKNSFRTVSEGVARLNPNTTSEQTVFVRPGVYNEQVLISPLSGPLVLQGFTCDAMSYASNEVTITQAKAQKDIPAEVKGEARNDMTSTVRFKSDNVKVYNLNIANTAGNVGQALAVNVNATDYGFYACNLTGYQDTVLADKGRELYARTGRESESSPASYVFNRARVFGSSGVNSTVLGRPWRPYARVIWQNSELGDVVKPEGWTTWDSTSSTANVTFKEYNNSGPGAATANRVAFSGQLDAPVAITELLGEGYETEWWVDTNYL
ncbi:unnamed protein product [Phytophthora lilii]|uniref:pectinesterase n=1 Tax=Phytophthora lilii TaxID=2077276 RepID=A0A9W6WWK9_9STRA|nr:unnamed protein product [Phytophthora lilii]